MVQIQVNKDKVYDGTIHNPKADTLSKEQFRIRYQDMTGFIELYERKTFKEQLRKCSLYHDLNEKYFTNKSALHFSQLSFLTEGFIENSTLSDVYMCFVNASQE
jgi:hypothetical protein